VFSAAVIATSSVARRRASVGVPGIALCVLPVVLLLGLATFLRLVEADIEDAWLVRGMNGLRHADIDLDPHVHKYFVSSHHDGAAGVLQTYGCRQKVGFTYLSPLRRSASAPSALCCLECWPPSRAWRWS
jgi:hypothetical protein